MKNKHFFVLFSKARIDSLNEKFQCMLGDDKKELCTKLIMNIPKKAI